MYPTDFKRLIETSVRKKEIEQVHLCEKYQQYQQVKENGVGRKQT